MIHILTKHRFYNIAFKKVLIALAAVSKWTPSPNNQRLLFLLHFCCLPNGFNILCAFLYYNLILFPFSLVTHRHQSNTTTSTRITAWPKPLQADIGANWMANARGQRLTWLADDLQKGIGEWCIMRKWYLDYFGESQGKNNQILRK